MSDEQKETQENRGVPFDLSSCMAMMEKMMAQHEGSCDCAELMSQMMGQDDRAAPSVMSQMMASCCGVQGETEETTSTDTTQEA